MRLQESKFLILVLFFLCSLQLLSQTQPKTYQIAGISVEGTHFADEQTILTYSGLRIGDQITIPNDSKIQTALKSLWQRKMFSSVEIKVDRITAIGMFLTIKVSEYPRLNQLIIHDAEEISTDKILKTLQKMRGDIVSPYEVYRMKKRIQKLYSEEGMQFAQVESTIKETDTANYVDVYLKIIEGAEFKVESIDFEGNNYFSDGDLRSSFDETNERKWWKFWKSSKFDPAKYKTDKDLLVKYMKQNGFIDGYIERDTVIFDYERGVVHITVWVNEGSKYYIRNIEFVGNTIYPSAMLLRRLDFKPGDLYDMDKFKLNLLGNPESTDALSAYLDNGYLYAAMKAEEKKVPPDSIDIIIRVTEGNRTTINRVDIVGNTKTKDKVIRRELYTQPGDFFNKAAIIRSIRGLGVLNYFAQEGLKPDVKPVDNNKVDVIYHVQERSTDQVNLSIGYAGSYGLTGAIGLVFNNFSISEPWRGGAGQVFSFNWEFGQANRIQNISLGFTEPWLFDEPTTVGFSLFDSRINYNYNLRRTGLSINLGRRFRWPDDYFRGDWNLTIQRNDVGTNSSYYYNEGISTEISIGQTFSRVSVDNLFFPTTGSKFTLSTQFAMGSIGLGTTDYLKNSLKFEISHPLASVEGNPRLVLFLSTNLGYITGLKSDTTISPIELYYMGGNGLSGYGVTPLRGYDDGAVGPSGGGKVLARHIAELRFALSLDPMPIYLYTFAEAGNVWSTLNKTDPFNLKRTAGFGLQLMMNPIGLIGFSYGYGFDNDDATGKRSGWKFLFHLGMQ